MRGRQMIVTTAMPDERCSRRRLQGAARARRRAPDRVKRTTALEEITWRIRPAASDRPLTDWPLLPFLTRRGRASPAKAGTYMCEKDATGQGFRASKP